MNLNQISLYRTQLMGISAIMIIVCHAPGNGVAFPFVISTLLSHCDIGVDIFLFLSGLGLYSSLNKLQGLSKHVLLKWYKKRLKRVLLPYFVFAIPVYGIKSFMDGTSIVRYLYNLSTLSFWTHHWGLWFVSMIIPLYFLAPLFFVIVHNRKDWILYLLILISTLSGLQSVDMAAWPIISNIHYCFMRLSSFLIGFLLAPMVLNKIEKPYLELIIKPLLLLFAIILITYVLHIDISFFSLYWTIMLPIVFFLCKVLSYNTFGIISTFIIRMGNISLESYCTNVFLPPLFFQLFDFVGLASLRFENNILYYTMAVFLSLIISNEINRFCTRVQNYNYIRF